ncbi:hypothetical protein SAMN05444064_12859 [Pseudomonas syringae]|nr:hypothetical protein SAMN05444514_12959 [Pseudomonas syringae]SFM72420.1 hypothetical protein SAMN05444064_12859 [Pseudomonas syringae]
MDSDGLCDDCRKAANLAPREARKGDGGYCRLCAAQISYGPGNKRNISVHGTDHLEVLKVTKDLSNQHHSKPLHILVTHWSFWFSSLLAILGAGIAIYGISGDTEVSFLGQTIKSANVGATAFFLGAVLVWRNIKNVLHYDSQGPT